MYKVLWFDDEHETLEAIDEVFLDNDIELIGVSNAKDGLSLLKERRMDFDAILLDGMFFNDSDQSGDPNDSAFGQVVMELGNLKTKGIIIPWFILSGQKNFVKERSAIIEMLRVQAYSNGRVFDKIDDKVDLCNEIKKAADNNGITKLKHKFPNAFSLCEENYLGVKEFSRVLQIIKDIENPENITNQQDALSPIRKILEAVFKKLNDIGIIPDEIQNGQGAINGASIFLAGYNKEYAYKKELIHPVITESIRHLLGLTQDASHNEGTKLRADTYLANNSNTYLYQSLCYSMLEVLEYLKPFIDDNSDIKINQSKWRLIEKKENFHEGLIAQDEQGNYYCDHYLLNYGFVHERFSIGQKIVILQEDQNTNPKTKDLFSHYAVKFKLF